MSYTNQPKFYKIDFSREIVVQGKTSTHLNIVRNDKGTGAMLPSEDLIVVLYPQAYTFETVCMDCVLVQALAVAPGPLYPYIFDFSSSRATPAFNNLSETGAANLTIKNYGALGFSAPPVIDSIEFINNTQGVITLTAPITVPIPFNFDLGSLSLADGLEWNINTAESGTLCDFLEEPTMSSSALVGTVPNPFDGTIVTGAPPYIETGYTYRISPAKWIAVKSSTTPSTENTNTKGATLRIDYQGNSDAHLKLNILIAKLTPPYNINDLKILVQAAATGAGNTYGIKSGDDVVDRESIDYQEVHFFGYPESYVTPTRVTEPMIYPIEGPIYEDRSSFGLIKTNPKISGNVKITTDSNGDVWLNSFDANDELADSSYKKFSVSTSSTYQRDLWSFFKNGQTPTDIVFDLYQVEGTYLNNKNTYEQQFDNFYNYGVEQLKSKFYDENLSFLAPLWLRKVVPDYFVIFRVDHPIDFSSYAVNEVSNGERFKNYFEGARIIKTFDLRNSSKLGLYIRKIVEDPRYRERPLEVSWEKDFATYWHGISYQNGTMTGAGEFLYDFFQQDRPIKEFEENITEGFQRNGIISTNLLNLEFLFDDEEAEIYSINRYFGLYVTENQLAEFEIEPIVLGKITDQTPQPKPEVDGEPYSTRTFVQTNPNGIQLPIQYYHSTSFTNNTSNIPEYQGLVVGKLPLPSLVDDPLRMFYVKDRDNVFKRVNQLTEVDYGYPGTTDYIRATQLRLFDTQEDISKYGGVNDIVSQFPAALLRNGNSQMQLHFFDQLGIGVLADDEEITIKVERFNDYGRQNTYHLQITSFTPTSVTFQFFTNQNVEQITAGFLQPAIGTSTGPIATLGIATDPFVVGATVFIVGGGYYRIDNVGVGTLSFTNLGGPQNVSPTTAVLAGSLLGQALSGEVTYNLNPLDFYLSVDNYLTLNLINYGVYTVGECWKVAVDYPDIQKTNLTFPAAVNTIDAFYRGDYEQFTWRMIANGVGLQPGDAWDYPHYDPNGTDYHSHFSNEGTSMQVAQAVAKCINSFDNIPVEAWQTGDVVYIRGKILFEEGNSIQIERRLKPTSVYANLGFYERGNTNPNIDTNIVDIIPLSTLDVKPILIDSPNQPGPTSYYFNIYRGQSNTLIYVRPKVNPASYASILTTGIGPFTTVTIPTREERYTDVRLPFSIDLSLIPKEVIFEQTITIDASQEPITQFFVGGERRFRNRAQIDSANGERYYQDRRVSRTGTTTVGSNLITIDGTGIYVGAPITGPGIPEETRIVDVLSASIVIDKLATASGTANLSVGELSILNDSIIYQQWYQAQKGKYSRMKGWDVQGKLVYSLPYLDEPIYGNDGTLSGFTDYDTKSIIQLDDADLEFYYSVDDRVVAYSVYRPTLGIFSIFPIKQFDFDFFLSDYSYTPTLEVFKYFFEEKLQSGSSVELPLFMNFSLQQFTSTGGVGTTNYDFSMDAWDPETGSWYNVNALTITNLTGPSSKILVNTFYPLYDYDANEFPYQYDPTNPSTPGPQYTSAGYRNYDRRYLYINTDAGLKKIYPTKFRLSVTNIAFGNYITIQNSNYAIDKDVRVFNGFAGLQDITTVQDADDIQKLKDEGKYVESYTYQLLLSEYDRLRENYNKDWAVQSQVVPYITKWVQEGTDARDNYYRLNTSMAFGISNISPLSQIEFSEPAVLTQEFPYLDSVPQDYPVDNLAGSRSYHFQKLSDIPAKGLSWYELLSSDNTNDWFTKYFSIGYPTEKDWNDGLIQRPREERFTFFNYISGLGRSQTLFRGGKVQPIAFDDTDPQNIVEVQNTDLFEGYKFAAITRFDSFDFYKRQKPVEIEVIRNEKYKWIAMVITIYTQDYRTQSGGSEYMFQYFMDDILSNSHQQQIDSIQTNLVASPMFTDIRSFVPYALGTGASVGFDYTTVLRPHQGFLGGGILRLGDKKLGGVMNDPVSISNTYTLSLTPMPQLDIRFNSTEPNYKFNALLEILPISNRYRMDSALPFSYPYLDQSAPITVLDFGQDGFTYNFVSTYQTASLTKIIKPHIDSQSRQDNIQYGNILIGSAQNTSQIIASLPLSPTNSGTSSNIPSAVGGSVVPPLVPPIGQCLETYHVGGGTMGFNNIKSYLTFGNLTTLVNSNDPLIVYWNVTDLGMVAATDYKISFIAPDSLVKTNVLHYSIDEDKPDEYKNTEIVGYNTVDTLGQEYIVRHRGFYEPKTRDLISFWVREDNAFSQHYEKDFLLSNTRIEALSSNVGLVRNYGINKVATSGNILQIARTSAYKSLYPLIGEVAVDHENYFALDSSWDNAYYRNYTTTTQFTEVEGIAEMKEQKGFLASKAMNLPKSYEVHTFNNNEVKFELIDPGLAIGVATLQGSTAAKKQSRPDAAKPKLVITLDLRARLLRQLIEEINSVVNIDEFERLQLDALPGSILTNLSTVQIDTLKKSYFEKNIIDLYDVSLLTLYVKNREGVELLNLNLNEIEKNRAGYKIDKDCVVRKLDTYIFEITKVLDPKVSTGFSLATTYQRI